MSDKCPDCDSTHVEFERSSGYAGWRCKDCGSWHYVKNDENPTGCKSTELQARITTLTKQLAAAREVIAADDAYHYSMTKLICEPGKSPAHVWAETRVARKAAAKLDKEPTDAP